MDSRPDRTTYYVGLAAGVASRSECLGGLSVGAVLVRDDRVVSTGYNGTPTKFPNCAAGSDVCPRCSRRGTGGIPSGSSYDLCICVHAETNAIAAAARYGMSTDGAALYVTHQPCITCAKELIQAGVEEVYYSHDLDVAQPPSKDDEELRQDLERVYERLMGRLRVVRVPPTDVVEGLATAVDRFGRDGRKTPTAAFNGNGREA